MSGAFRRVRAVFCVLIVASCSLFESEDGGSSGGVGASCVDQSACSEGTVCTRGKCFEPTAVNGAKDGDETDVDCGGTRAPTCDDGKACAAGTDCSSASCGDGVCLAPSPTDKVKNGDETDVDCGGATAPKCGRGLRCNVTEDCDAVACDQNVCGSPAHIDGIKNSDETGVDCGGPGDAKRCAPGQGCDGDSDCDATRCDATARTCNVATADDGLKNQGETDVDCGGTNAPKCGLTKTCAADGDCASTACNYAKKCVSSRSCKVHFGGDTCGTGEVGEPTAAHEDCCINTPAGTAKVDRYKVTAGRVRAFLEAVNWDAAAWWQANKNTIQPLAKTQLDPYLGQGISGGGLGVGGTVRLPSGAPDSYPDGAYYYLGAVNYYAPTGSSQGCFVGNAGNQANGAHTFDTPEGFESEVRGIGREQLDTLPINCIPYPLLVAFCAWDGGHLATYAEIMQAYGTSRFPWGATPLPAGYNPFGQGGPRGPADQQSGTAPYYAACTAGTPSCDTDLINFGYTYQYPIGGNATKGWDYSFYISPPGRFARDRSPTGHKDLGGLMLEWLGDFSRNLAGAGPLMKMGVSASWEGHGMTGRNAASEYHIMRKYGKISGRCAR